MTDGRGSGTWIRVGRLQLAAFQVSVAAETSFKRSTGAKGLSRERTVLVLPLNVARHEANSERHYLSMS